MGLGTFFNRLAGRDTSKGPSSLCFVFGEDKRYSRRTVESTGLYFQDNGNRLAYKSAPSAIGVLMRTANGNARTLGPVSIAYEPSSHMYNFPTLAWAQEKHDEEVILDTAFAEGCSRAVQREEGQEWMNRLTTILLLAVMGAVLLVLLFAAQSGMLQGIFQKLPQLIPGR